MYYGLVSHAKYHPPAVCLIYPNSLHNTHFVKLKEDGHANVTVKLKIHNFILLVSEFLVVSFCRLYFFGSAVQFFAKIIKL